MERWSRDTNYRESQAMIQNSIIIAYEFRHWRRLTWDVSSQKAILSVCQEQFWGKRNNSDDKLSDLL